MDSESNDTARFYTRTRKIPHLVGKLHDGTRLPGGPYTLTQLAVLVGVPTVGFLTMPLWSFASWFIEVPLILLAGWGAAFLVGQIPVQRRNIVAAAVAAVSAYTKPSAGRVNGRVPRLNKPHVVRSSLAPQPLHHPPAVNAPVEAAATPAPIAEPVAAIAEPEPAHSTPLSGMERLLLQAQEA